ncbi:hypothetical protein QYM36_019105 [Artemia franciscana]|uniref:Uncharacterized protein n=1 Tax=Artemia franciscana TaxID=6661 RepID=A0AA88H5P0_ARTSF|nr:hypothetical protein QYM36_019105 [Artemia franciscana]
MSDIPPYDTDIDFRDEIPFLTTLEQYDDELADDKNYRAGKESKSVENLIPHSYITKSQSKTFKKLKEDPPLNTAIVVMDLSENYSYTIQNEILSYHWNRGGCTIHPVGLYLKKDDEVFISNHCFISDDLQHDTSFVNYAQTEISECLKENHPKINQVHYFTDGCAGQYKNRNSFKNLTNHHKDFEMKAEHSFFAISHGKSICHGLGGTVQRILRTASLQLSDENEIKTSTAVYDFCKVNIEKNDEGESLDDESEDEAMDDEPEEGEEDYATDKEDEEKGK